MSRKLASVLGLLGLLAWSWPGPRAVPTPPRTWVVAVGIDDYVRESIPDLRFAAADARLMAAVSPGG